MEMWSGQFYTRKEKFDISVKSVPPLCVHAIASRGLSNSC